MYQFLLNGKTAVDDGVVIKVNLREEERKKILKKYKRTKGVKNENN